jgi:hypothetical protein
MDKAFPRFGWMRAPLTLKLFPTTCVNHGEYGAEKCIARNASLFTAVELDCDSAVRLATEFD